MVITTQKVNQRKKMLVEVRCKVNGGVETLKMKKGCIEMLPRFKIQYPMKNRCKDEVEIHR